MATFMLEHRHAARECGAAFAAWRGFESPLGGRPVLASCRAGGHRIWWTAEAPDAAGALALLPPFVAERTLAYRVWPAGLPGAARPATTTKETTMEAQT
ncbi:MAG: hypothetical protein MUE51_03705 [Thermoleophilia bacterium]|jgi:hypothetical protein|nr:hypothetical protein [Thermoleophilia bacterium]